MPITTRYVPSFHVNHLQIATMNDFEFLYGHPEADISRLTYQNGLNSEVRPNYDLRELHGWENLMQASLGGLKDTVLFLFTLVQGFTYTLFWLVHDTATSAPDELLPDEGEATPDVEEVF
jgi:hypothetical protein